MPDSNTLGLEHWTALILFYFKEDAELMDEDKLCKRINQLDYALRQTGKMQNYG
jgi:hypothetical protein